MSFILSILLAMFFALLMRGFAHNVGLAPGEQRKLLTAVMIVTVLMGVGFTYASWSHWQQKNHWVQTTGRMTSDSFVTFSCPHPNPDPQHQSNDDWDRVCPRVAIPRASYSYEVDGAQYEGNTVSLARNVLPSRDAGNAWVAQHKRGMEVTLFYDPDDPSQSALYNDGDPPLDLSKALFAFVFLACCAWLRRSLPTAP